MPGLPPRIGDFVEVRGRPWPVEGIDDKGEGLSALKLSCISDDAQGEALEVAWDAAIGARRLEVPRATGCTRLLCVARMAVELPGRKQRGAVGTETG